MFASWVVSIFMINMNECLKMKIKDVRKKSLKLDLNILVQLLVNLQVSFVMILQYHVLLLFSCSRVKQYQLQLDKLNQNKMLVLYQFFQLIQND